MVKAGHMCAQLLNHLKSSGSIPADDTSAGVPHRIHFQHVRDVHLRIPHSWTHSDNVTIIPLNVIIDITGREFLPLLVASTILKQVVIVTTGKLLSSLVRQSNGSVLISEGWNER